MEHVASVEDGGDTGLGVRVDPTPRGAIPRLRYPLEEETGWMESCAPEEGFLRVAWGERAPFYSSGTCPESSFAASAVESSAAPDAPPPAGSEPPFAADDESSASTEASPDEGVHDPEASAPLHRPAQHPRGLRSLGQRTLIQSSLEESDEARSPLKGPNMRRDTRDHNEHSQDEDDVLSGSVGFKQYNGESRRIWTASRSWGAPLNSRASTDSSDGGAARPPSSHLAQPPSKPVGPQRSRDRAKYGASTASGCEGEVLEEPLHVPPEAGPDSQHWWQSHVPGPQSRCSPPGSGSPGSGLAPAASAPSATTGDPSGGHGLQGATPRARQRPTSRTFVSVVRGRAAYISVCCVQ